MQMDRPKQAQGDALVKDAAVKRHLSAVLVLTPRTQLRNNTGIAGQARDVLMYCMGGPQKLHAQ